MDHMSPNAHRIETLRTDCFQGPRDSLICVDALVVPAASNVSSRPASEMYMTYASTMPLTVKRMMILLSMPAGSFRIKLKWSLELHDLIESDALDVGEGWDAQDRVRRVAGHRVIKDLVLIGFVDDGGRAGRKASSRGLHQRLKIRLCQMGISTKTSKDKK